MAQACYTSPYLPASFKGFPFDAMDARSEHGRRGATGEFPFGENTAYADLGRRIRKYPLRARFVTNDHVAQASAFATVCESKGSGPLVHPTRGLVNVACVHAKFSDNILEEQGITYVDLEFVEANDWPNGLQLGGSLLGLAVGTILAVARETFLQKYNPVAIPIHRRQDVLNDASSIIFQIHDEYAAATSSAPTIDIYDVRDELIQTAKDTFLLSKPKVVDETIALGINAVADKLTGDAKVQAMRRIANSISARQAKGRAVDSQDALHSLTRIVSGVFMAQGIVEQSFANSTVAFQYYDRITALLQAEARIAYDNCDNNLFLAIREFTINTQNAILKKAYNAPALVRYSMTGGHHPLVAAYQIFGDAKRHRELELGNAIENNKFRSSIAATGA